MSLTFKAIVIPILFNPLKHHLAELQQTLLLINPSDINFHLLALGGSQMDMYAGHLSTDTIFREIREQLQRAGVHNRSDYEAFLAHRDHYATLVLSDTSRWILRLAADKSCYIHLHPGRYSPHTFRVKASALKTALAWWVTKQHHLLTGDLQTDLHQLRKGLGLPPLKNISESNHILKIMSLLDDTGSEEI
ncbi:hypothetical protein [Chitinophaga sp.]|uniref:hypothetical protein n=1 Tax=Chitinophaga sp. TaxID=1869181 RepID=UPI002F94F837